MLLSPEYGASAFGASAVGEEHLGGCISHEELKGSLVMPKAAFHGEELPDISVRRSAANDNVVITESRMTDLPWK